MGPGPVHDEGLSFYRCKGHKPPESAVVTVIPVVPHDEKVALRDGDGTEAGGGLKRGCIYPVLVLEQCPIDIDRAPENFDPIAREANHAFNKIFARIHGVDKYNDIIPVRMLNGNDRLSDKRELDPVDEFVDQNVIAHQQGWFHGARGYLESLHDKRSYKQGKEDGNDCSLRVFSENALFLYFSLGS